VDGWPRNIAWSEFRDVDSGEGDEMAQIKPDILLPEGRINVVHEGATVRLEASFRARLVITRSQSWVVRGQQSNALLHHEQGHYDIAGLEARACVRELRALRASNANDLQQQVTATLSNHQARLDRLEAQYDTDTRNGRNQNEQDRWDRLISAAMSNGSDLPTN
jgi:uncharacterized protein DUF922